MNMNTSRCSLHDFPEEEDAEDDLEESHIEWNNLIFLPFHPVFKLMVLFSVIVKSILGPIQSVYPIVHCWDTMDCNAYLSFIKFFYWYCCDTIYGIDTFLHIVHRQVTDKAMRREHLPKSAFLLMVDIVSLIPFSRFMVSDVCPPVQLWPNVLNFTEFFIIYRIVEYFSLVTTHSFWSIMIGFTLLLACSINCASSFWLLLTRHGLCGNCKKAIYDWRNFIMHKLNETDESFATYVYGTVLVFSYTINRVIDETKPSTIIEYIAISVLSILGYLLGLFVVFPKIFAEAIFRLRMMCSYYPQVRRLVEEAKRRNSSPKAYIQVENYFNVMWMKRSGITKIPECVKDLPRYLRLEIKQDLVWQLFYHSPVLRNLSIPLKRMLSELIITDYKLPGEKFFCGFNSQLHVFYLKTGVVEILSVDDGVTSILSVTSGTIFGDISFLVPPLNRKVILRCLTYCEVIYLARSEYLKCLHKYPDDRRHVLNKAMERIKHARTLYACKQHVRGLDRTEDEGIAWIKRRWWEISDTIGRWNKRDKKDNHKYQLPPEETVYHCSKYIGLLVLCNDLQLQTKSLFARAKFPWILIPNSSFGMIWHRIVVFTVCLVLLFYPPNIAKRKIPTWFIFVQFWTDLIYAADICVSLLTAISRREDHTPTFASVMFARCKTFHFMLDVMASIWLEYVVVVIGKPELYNVIQLNRLIKIYILFTGYNKRWNVKYNPMIIVCYTVLLFEFSFVYILSHVIYVISRASPNMTTEFFFGSYTCESDVPEGDCEPGRNHIAGIAIAWTLERVFPETLPSNLVDVYYAMIVDYASFVVFTLCKAQFVAALYLKYREVTNFQYFVSNLKKIYRHYKIHQDLLRRLNRYLFCHWKYHKGVDILHPNVLQDEAYEIYWNVQGEIAEKIIADSPEFVGADHMLVKELAFAAKMLILPKYATLILFGVKCKYVTWIVQGSIRCEYYNEHGELFQEYYGPGYMLSTSSVFLKKESLRTYSACTDCEILYIKIRDFFKIVKRFPEEWSYFNSCIKEFEPVFEEMFENYLQKYKDYHKQLRDLIFHARNVTLSANSIRANILERNTWTLAPIKDILDKPESKFMNIWIFFRTLIVIVSILNASVQGGSGAVVRYPLIIIGEFCDFIAWVDIIMKLFLAYYDDRGLLIKDKTKCMLHYVTRGFALDIIGALPWFAFLRAVMTNYINDDIALLVNTTSKFAHLYLVVGYFNYIGDIPTVNVAYIMIVKWQVVTILTMFGAAHYLIHHCIDLTFDNQSSLIDLSTKNTCWMPKFYELHPKPDFAQLHILYAESLNLAQSGLMKMNFGRFHIDRNLLGVGFTLFILGLLYWFVMCYSLTLLVLNSRGNTVFEHGVGQLRKFLMSERVDKKLIHQATTYFTYWWLRTKGVNIHKLTHERIGVVLRQDLNYFFFEQTFTALDTLLLGGEELSRQLASCSSQIYMLPGQKIIREMDIASYVHVVHRGRVTISQGGEKIITLTKGSIFGQLINSTPRSIRVSAISDDFADLLEIPIRQFQELIDDEIRKNIAQHPTSENDYIATKKYVAENPYDSIQYILRGRKTIKLPGMHEPLESHSGNRYSAWLYVAWLFAPFTSTCIGLLLVTFPPDIIPSLWWCFMLMDFIHIVNLVTEFFTMDLVIIDQKCVPTIVGLRRFQNISLYIDAFAILIPMLTYVTGEWRYRLACFLRLRLLHDFHYYFCKSFKSKAAPILLKFLIVVLILHAMSCIWIFIACRNETFPLEMPELVNISIDRDNWVLPTERKGGCARMTRNIEADKREMKPGFVVPKRWQDDYIIAITLIILLHTHTGITLIFAMSLTQIYFNLTINFLIYLIDMWIMSVVISFVYTKFRELYQYDHDVKKLVKYLKESGVSSVLLNSVMEYTMQLWRRQRGTWLPELAQQAPICLREDLLGALYMHHLEAPPLFRHLPKYFVRQLAARLQRIVIFPGKCIVQEGDIFSCIYFIHEGEVEKWYTDKNGDRKMMALLSTNEYFGLVPGLFTNAPFRFSYFSRTVVDFVFLKLRDWQDLLDGYPDVKRELYVAAKQLKKEVGTFR